MKVLAYTQLGEFKPSKGCCYSQYYGYFLRYSSQHKVGNFLTSPSRCGHAQSFRVVLIR